VPNTGARAIIRAVSEEARLAGIQKGMLLSTAKRYCRDMEVLPFDAPYYNSASEALYLIASTMSNLVEPHLGKVYVDLSFAGSRSEKTCWQAIQEIRARLRIAPLVGLACNKVVSRVAAQVSGENSLCQVQAGTEKKFLRPFLARVLPVVDEVIWRQLQLMGLDRIGSLANFSADDLAVIFGRNGVSLHDQANGIDFSPVVSPRQEKNKTFVHVLAPDSNDLYLLRDHLLRLVETACREMRSEHRFARRIALEVEYSDARITARSKILRLAASDDMTLKNAAAELLEKTVRRRVSVRVMTFSITEFVPAMQQLSLFDAPVETKHHKIDMAMDAIRGRFGKE
jgi:DNA polymerase-4